MIVIDYAEMNGVGKMKTRSRQPSCLYRSRIYNFRPYSERHIRRLNKKQVVISDSESEQLEITSRISNVEEHFYINSGTPLQCAKNPVSHDLKVGGNKFIDCSLDIVENDNVIETRN